MNPNIPASSVRFGIFEVDFASGELRRQGVRIKLQEQPFQALIVLLQRPRELVTRDELQRRLWPADTVVDFDRGLSKAINRLREALGDVADNPRFIETLPQRGYRFIAQVETIPGPLAASPAAPGTPRGYRLIGTIAAPEEPAPKPPGTDKEEPDGESNALDTAHVSSKSSRRKTELIPILILVMMTVIGTGIWMNFRVKKTREMDRLLFQGAFYMAKWNEDDVRRAIDFHSRAASLDPTSASAYHGLAADWIFLSDVHVSPREAMPKAMAAAQKVLQLDERSVDGHLSMGVIKTQYEWDWLGAEKEFKRALALDDRQDTSAHQIYAWYLIAAGRPDEAPVEMRRLLEADPQDGFSLWGLGLSYYFARQYEPAIEQYRRAIGVEPKSHWPHMLLGWAYEQRGKFAEAMAELNEASRLFDNNPQVLAAIGHTYARSGQRAAAQEVLAKLGEIAKRRYVSPYDVATIYAGLDEKEQALDWLERAYEDRSGWLAWWLKSDPKFDILRSDSRFKNLLMRIGLPEK